jgi:hypothetical protein
MNISQNKATPSKLEEKKELPRSFSANGKVDPRKHFYVDPRPWNEKNLVPKLENGGFYILLAPSQSGKTTKCDALLEVIENTQVFVPIWYTKLLRSFYRVDIRGVVGEVIGGNKEFFPTFFSHVETFLKTSLKGIKTLIELFSQESKVKYFQNKNAILLMDEIDSIADIDEKLRKAFFGQLSNIKQSWKEGKSLYCLYSALIITNWSGDYLRDTFGNSPFNVSDTIYLDYFTVEEFLDLWSQYEKQEGLPVDKQIKVYMYNISEGAPGVVSMLGKYYHTLVQLSQSSISFLEWLRKVNSAAFWDAIESYPNFSKMVSVIEDPRIIQPLLLYMGENAMEYLSDAFVKNSLLKANILKRREGVGLSFASRFVRMFLDVKIRQVIPEPQELPLKEIELEHGKKQFRVDVPEFVALVAQYMNRGVITFAQKKDNKTSQSKKAQKGPKEVVYVNQFNDTIRLIFPSYVITIVEQKASKLLGESTQSCDCSYDFGDFGTILIEHGANLSVTSGLRQRYSLDFHVYDQAEKYHTSLNPDETWVVHWTTVNNKSTYVFPESETVSVLHVYHDKVFHHLKVVSEDETMEVENALPTLNLKRKQEHTEGVPSKEPKLEASGLKPLSLVEFLREKGLEKREVKGDGFCLFRSISSLVSGNDLNTPQILNTCILYLEKNKISEIFDFRSGGKDQNHYLQRFKYSLQCFQEEKALPMEKWPDDDLFLLILARALGINVVVHQFMDGQHTQSQSYHSMTELTRTVILLNEGNIHYGALIHKEITQETTKLSPLQELAKIPGKMVYDSFLEETKAKWVVIRKFHQKEGGRKIKLPKDISELLKEGSDALKIKAVQVRDLQNKAEITDIEAIQDGEVVYLTTEADEKQFQ